MDYKQKYLKYKQKYLQLKKYLQFGGVVVGDNINNMKGERLGKIVYFEGDQVVYQNLLTNNISSVSLKDENKTWIVDKPLAPPPPYSPQQNAPQLSPRLQQVRDAVKASIAAAPKAAPAYEDEHPDNPFLAPPGPVLPSGVPPSPAPQPQRIIYFLNFPFYEAEILKEFPDQYNIRYRHNNQDALIFKEDQGKVWKFKQ